MTRWKTFRYWLEELACRVLLWGIPQLSRQGCVRLGNALGTLAYRLDARGRAVALSNLECAFGNRFSPQERSRITERSYQNFLRTMLDLFWSPNLTEGTYQEWVRIEGLEIMQERLKREQRSAVMMCIHQGNWEWASLAAGFRGTIATIVVENFKNPRLTALFSRLRGGSGHTTIAQEYSLLRMLRTAKRGGINGMLIDLSLPPTQASAIIDGFGMKMCVPVIQAILTQRTHSLMIPVETQPQPDGTCRVIIHPAVDYPEDASPEQIAQKCWDTMEPIVHARPEEYLWPYKHFRYKPKGVERPYPTYANESGKFEKALRKTQKAARE
jgi:Kdo2-lipid IVA lauroyltransferase/acyltransferase